MLTLITTNNTLNPPPEAQDKNPDVSNSNSTLAAVAKASVETDDDIKDPPPNLKCTIDKQLLVPWMSKE
jgi:hypothetical protein